MKPPIRRRLESVFDDGIEKKAFMTYISQRSRPFVKFLWQVPDASSGQVK